MLMIVCHLHDNARPHAGRLRVELLEGFGWNVLTNPPHSPDSVPCDYRAFYRTGEKNTVMRTTTM